MPNWFWRDFKKNSWPAARWNFFWPAWKKKTRSLLKKILFGYLLKNNLFWSSSATRKTKLWKSLQKVMFLKWYNLKNLKWFSDFWFLIVLKVWRGWRKPDWGSSGFWSFWILKCVISWYIAIFYWCGGVQKKSIPFGAPGLGQSVNLVCSPWPNPKEPT